MDHCWIMNIAVLLFILPGGSNVCDMHYPEEGSCLKKLGWVSEWKAAKGECKLYGEFANLVQIWNRKKDQFVRGHMQDDNDHWIGTSDLDDDGMFEYINGSLLRTSEPGLGNWQSRGVKSEGKCVVQKRYNGWSREHCFSRLYSICETYDTSPPQVTFPSKACTPTDCQCRRNEWTYFKRDNTYIKVNRHAANFSTSTALCRKLTGNLLVVADLEKENFLKSKTEWWYPGGILYWMGLKYEQLNERWSWSDGKELTGYTNWFDTNSTKRMCVGVAWDNLAKWGNVDCELQLYHICEAITPPCSTFPVIFINGKSWLNNDDVTIIKQQRLDVKCVVTGYYDPSISLRLICQGKEKIKANKKNVTAMLPVYEGTHKQKCECRAVHIDEAVDTTSIRILFKSNPQLLSVSDYNKLYSIDKGENFIFSFPILANPVPTLKDLKGTGRDVNIDDFKIDFEKNVDKDLRYVVLVNIPLYSSHQSGSYVLIITNGIEPDLKFLFRLKEPCDVLPVFEIDDERVLENNSTRSIDDVPGFEIKCFPSGCNESVTHISLFCIGDDNNKQTVTGVQMATGAIKISDIEYTKQCACRSTNKYKVQEQSTIDIDIGKAPRLFNDSENSIVHKAQEGDSFSLKFSVFANPEPDVDKFTNVGSGIINKDHIVIITSSGIPCNYTAAVYVLNFNATMNGTYHLTLTNGMKPNLVIVFTLAGVKNSTKEYQEPGKSLGPGFELSVLMALGISIMVAYLFIVLIKSEKDDYNAAHGSKGSMILRKENPASDKQKGLATSVKKPSEYNSTGSQTDSDDSESFSSPGSSEFSSTEFNNGSLRGSI